LPFFLPVDVVVGAAEPLSSSSSDAFFLSSSSPAEPLSSWSSSVFALVTPSFGRSPERLMARM
jgi:hypothetical protein